MTEVTYEPEFETAIRSAVPALGDDPLQPNTDLLRYGLGSLALVRLLLALQNHYDIELSFELINFASPITPKGLWAIVAEARGEGHSMQVASR